MIIVHEASARYGEFTMEQEDHFSLCQPESRLSNTYTRLTEFIRCIDKDIHPLKVTHTNMSSLPVCIFPQ